MDAYGNALKAYIKGLKKSKIKVECDIAETEYWPVSEFFHSWNDMSLLERTALEHCHGKILDIGAGSGCHSLWLQNNGKEVTSIDISEGAIEVMKEQGLKDIRNIDFYNAPTIPEMKHNYDTLLLLMNGAGIAGTIANLPRFLLTCKELINDNGCVIMDSSDLIYLFLDEDGSALIDLNASYYGELNYTMSFKGEKDKEFPWLFIDFDTLCGICEQEGWSCSKIAEDDHYQYLAELRIK